MYVRDSVGLLRILFISFYFAPYNAVGAVRPTRIAEQLEHLGNTVYVVSAERQPFPQGLGTTFPERRITRTSWINVNAPLERVLGPARVAAAGYGGTDRGSRTLAVLGNVYRILLHIPDAQIGWCRNALRAGLTIAAREGPFDVLYASAPPFTALIVASRLARELGVPWVAELRDLWADNHNYSYGPLRHALDLGWEKRVLASARGLVTVSEELAARLRERYGQEIAVVENGFDECDVPDVTPEPEGSEFEIVYTGSFYPAYDVKPLFSAVALMGSDAERLKFRFFGRNLMPLARHARAAELAARFEFSPTVSHAEAIKHQREADALLFFIWPGGSGRGVLTSKLFEYLGARRPIIAIGDPDSDAGRRIVETCSGVVSSEPSRIAQWLREAVNARVRSGRVPDLPKEAIAHYSRARQAEKLAAYLRRLVAQSDA